MASASLFGSHGAQAKLFAELTWLNPFSARRAELDAQLQAGAASGDLEAVLALLEQLLNGVRGAYVKGSGSVEDRRLYQDMVFFRLFHLLIEDFDRVIEQAHARGHAGQRMAFYDTFIEEAEHWLPDGLEGEFAGIGFDWLFAVYFQVRRAYLHIHRYFIGKSEAANRLRERIWQSIFTHNMNRYQRVLADRMGDVITLITGPSGTGKELVAQGIGLSRFIVFDPNRREFAEDFVKAFYPINLTALSPTLIESELFGHRKGAFTGAMQDRRGYFETCGRYGTVFLDEIGETAPEIQVKLLRVLQSRLFVPIGETAPRRFEGKLMAATNRDLVEEIAAGRFREDFYFRLNADRVQTPALREILRESPGELETLVAHIATKLAGPEEGPRLTDEVCAWIHKHLPTDYPWPGNFRELEQCVRNITVHGKYEPESRSAGQGKEASLLHAWDAGSYTAESLLARYVADQYTKIPNYEELGRRLGLDRRTVKKYLELSRAE